MSIIPNDMPAVAVSPILKWAGGKQGIATRLVRFFPKDYDRYFEPFVGGGSVFLELSPASAVLGDANDWLIDTYEAIREDHARVAATLDTMVNTRAEYMRIRRTPIQTLDRFRRAAHLVYLNKTCFRGLFRVNRDGQFNVPYGEYRRRYYDPVNLRCFAGLLGPVEFRRGDFELCLYDVTDRDFVYLDPPYYKQGGYSDFNRYTKDQFRSSDHFRLAAACREMDLRGVRWAVSNSDTALVRDLFAGYHMVTVENRREINLNSRDRDIKELLITNFNVPKPPCEPGLFDAVPGRAVDQTV